MAKGSKSPAGRPTKYNPDTYPEKAFKLALLGLTDAEMAVSFDVTEQTFNNWKRAHPEFFESLKSGREDADAKVAGSLYKRAMAGDTTSAIFWLKNRRSKSWRDKQDVTLQNPDGSNLFDGVKFVGIDVAAGVSEQDT